MKICICNQPIISFPISCNWNNKFDLKFAPSGLLFFNECRMIPKKLKWDQDFSDIAIKGRASKGNTVTKYPIKKIELKEKGISTLRPRKIWFDES